MATIMKYDEYIAEIEFDSDYETFFGNVINLSTPVTFYGKTVKELKQEFIRSIKTYLAVCKERGIEPDKPFSGKLILRINPDLHRKIASSAQREGKSVNKWIAETLEEKAA
jgi:predicted HicB family RNase H-like nuclease